MDKVSIITPMYNASRYIRQTIESVLAQSYENFELIIINDMSKDDSLKICSEYEDERIKIIDLKENVGVCRARNIGIENSSGRYIAFLDADDYWENKKLEVQISYMKKHDSKISCMSYYRVNEKNEIIGFVDVKEHISYNDMLKNNYVGCLSLVYDKEFFKDAKFLEISKNEDYLLWLDLIKKSKKIDGICQRLSYYRVLDVSRSSNKIKTAIKRFEIYRKYEKLSILKSIYYLSFYFFNALIKNRRKSK